MDSTQQATIAQKFQSYAKKTIASSYPENHSLLYYHLATHVATDPEVMALVSTTDLDKQLPNLLFGAVHMLLLEGVQHPLRAYYPNLTADSQPPQDAYPHFRDFCLQHAAQIRPIVETRFAQINEVNRCTVLLPALSLVGQRANGQPLALLEVGASGGLLLLWDHYRYNYSGEQVGPADSAVELVCELRGDQRPPIDIWPAVAGRLGMDIHPVDLNNPEDAFWLRALTWPGHAHRAQRLEHAIAVTQGKLPPVLQGDARTDIIQLAADLPADAPLVVFYSALLSSVHADVLAQCATLAQQREVYVIAISAIREITLYDFVQGGGQAEHIANASGFGHWLEWLASATP